VRYGGTMIDTSEPHDRRAPRPSVEPAWLAVLRRAVRGTASPGIEVARGARPGFLSGDAVHALISTLLAALVLAAAVLRGTLSAGQFDLIALLLRTASVAFALRAAIAIAAVVRRTIRDRAAESHALAWSSEGLLESRPEGERWVAREDVLGFALPDERPVRGASSSRRPLYVVLTPEQAPRYWTLPPYYAASSEILQARLLRWLGTREAALPELAPPVSAPDERYLRAAEGRLAPGEVAVPEGFGYRLRAPYGALLALVFVGDALLQAGTERARLLAPAGLALALVPIALAVWFSWLRSRRAARLGLALLLTPEELLVRGKHGVASVPWTQLASVDVTARLAWSPFVGSYLVRMLSFQALDGSLIPFDESFLGVPADVIAVLAKAYRSGEYEPVKPALDA
jgi:hypothetical protein